MHVLIACVVFACCISQADAGILNLFYEPPELIAHRRELRNTRKMHATEMKTQRSMHRTQTRHAARMGVYHSPAVTDLNMAVPSTMSSHRYSVPYYAAPRPVIRYYGATRYYGW